MHRFRGGLALDPENANLRLDLGNALLDLGRDDAAREQFARALAIRVNSAGLMMTTRGPARATDASVT